MKLLSDFLPIVLFFIAFKFFGIYVATAVAIAASLLQVLIVWIKTRRLEPMHFITLAMITVLGGATLVFHNDVFIKWKPTAINWLLAIVFAGSQIFGSKPLIRRLMEKNIELPTALWSRINLSWIIFFITLGALNLYVAYHFDTNTWVNFKLFGVLGATIIFIVIQGIYLTQHMNKSEQNN